jgi:transcriptional regulator with XRE-family HTH domain
MQRCIAVKGQYAKISWIGAARAMPPGPKRSIPSAAELRKMPAFQRKLHRFVGPRPVAALAREIGMEASTLQRWLSGQSPTLSALRSLAEGSGIAVSYWADDAIPLRDHAGPGPEGATAARLGPLAAAAAPERARGGPTEDVEALTLDAADPRVLEVRGRPLLPFASDRGEGEVLVYDAARPGRVKDGDLVVVELDGELTIARRRTVNDQRLYVPPDPDSQPVLVPLKKVGKEYPVVALILRPRRGKTPAVGEAEPDAMAAEDPAAYGRRRPDDD